MRSARRSRIDARTHSQGDAGRIFTDGAAAQDHDVRRQDAGHSAEEHAASALRIGLVIGAHESRYAAGDFGHRLEDRQLAAVFGDGLIADRRHFLREQRRHQRPVGR